MKRAPHIASPPMDRRHFLRGAGGVLMGLPLLDAMVPCFGQSSSLTKNPKRVVAMCAGLGFHSPYFFPTTEGKNFEITPYLKPLAAHRDKMTILSGVSHPSQQGNNGHASELTWLTSAKRPGLAGFKNTISLDQLVAQKIGAETRLPFLALSSRGVVSLSWTASGVAIPAEERPSRLFRSMFVDGTPEEIDKEVKRYRTGRSIMDTVLGEAHKLEKRLGHRDQEKLDEYLTSVRELEVRLEQTEEWAKLPKPKTAAAEPRDVDDQNDVVARQKLMYDMIHLAFQSDSTRTVTFNLSGMNAVPSNLQGVKTDWHNLSHHGRDEDKISELKLIEEAEFQLFGEFLDKLAATQEDGGPLLDKTTVLFGSNLGNASSHNSTNLPIIVAGGGLKHGGYVAHDAKENTPFANLFVTLAQNMGVEIDQFGSSTAAGLNGVSLA
ncbi:MAG: DUF1552 domain-containing protein [Verrucomicrobiota bacterium]